MEEPSRVTVLYPIRGNLVLLDASNNIHKKKMKDANANEHRLLISRTFANEHWLLNSKNLCNKDEGMTKRCRSQVFRNIAEHCAVPLKMKERMLRFFALNKRQSHQIFRHFLPMTMPRNRSERR